METKIGTVNSTVSIKIITGNFPKKGLYDWLKHQIGRKNKKGEY